MISSTGRIVADRGSGVRVAVTTIGSAVVLSVLAGSAASALVAAMPAAIAMQQVLSRLSPPCDAHARRVCGWIARGNMGPVLLSAENLQTLRRPRFPT